jgi:hypothetical protein
MPKTLYRTTNFKCAIEVEPDGAADVLIVNRRTRVMRYLEHKGGGSDLLRLLNAVANTPDNLDTALAFAWHYGG